MFFRSRTRLQWRDEEGSNIFTEQRFTLFQRLDDRSAIAYETIFETVPASRSVFDDNDILVEPDDKYTQIQLRLRYRRNVKWPWFFVEFWPGIGWAEQRDYETVFGGRVRFEVLLGHVPSYRKITLDQ